MTDTSRLSQWVNLMFDSSNTTDDVLDYLFNNVRGYPNMKKASRRAIIHDWEHHVGIDVSFRDRVRGFLRRLF
jgi:hypothetical protein